MLKKKDIWKKWGLEIENSEIHLFFKLNISCLVRRVKKIERLFKRKLRQKYR